MKWFWGILVAVVVAAGAGVAAYRYLRPAVDVTEVIDGPVVEAFYATGTVSAEHEYSVRSNVAGIIHLSVDKGSNVKRGQVLETKCTLRAVRAFITKRLDVHWGRVYS